jgi:hypothetical protein
MLKRVLVAPIGWFLCGFVCVDSRYGVFMWGYVGTRVVVRRVVLQVRRYHLLSSLFVGRKV